MSLAAAAAAQHIVPPAQHTADWFQRGPFHTARAPCGAAVHTKNGAALFHRTDETRFGRPFSIPRAGVGGCPPCSQSCDCVAMRPTSCG
eukprot:357701-Chlamydomonas_euryale.AAC.4